MIFNGHVIMENIANSALKIMARWYLTVTKFEKMAHFLTDRKFEKKMAHFLTVTKFEKMAHFLTVTKLGKRRFLGKDFQSSHLVLGLSLDSCREYRELIE